MAQAFFLEDPDCPTLVKQEQKVSGPSTPQETSSDLFSFYILYYLILLLSSNLIIVRGPEKRRKTLDACASHITHASGWNHALSQARFRRRRR